MAITWQEVQPAGDVDKDWVKCLSSADGTVLIALHETVVEHVYTMYISVDSGETWENRSPGEVYLIEMSTDASIIFVACYSGDDYFLYVSNDYGESWAGLTDNPSEGGVSKIAVSGDGTTIYASTAENKLFKATEWLLPGDPWEEITLPVGHPDVAPTVSANQDGSEIVIRMYDMVYLSINGGVDWSELNPVIEGTELEGYSDVSISADGSKIFVGYHYYNPSYVAVASISIDGGETWQLANSEEPDDVIKVIITRNGEKLLLSKTPNPAYSENNGVDWTSFLPDDVPEPPEDSYWDWSSTINTNNILTGCKALPNPY